MDSNATGNVAYISLRIYENANRPETKKFRTRVSSFDSDHLSTVIKKGVRIYLEDVSTNRGDVDANAVDDAIKRIRKMTCGTTDPSAMNLVQFINDPHATVALLDCDDSPIINKGIDIYLPKAIEVVDVDDVSESPKKKPKPNAFEVLRGRELLLNVQYLEFDTDLDRERNIADEIGDAICAVFSDINLGYVTGDQQALLKRNHNTMKNSLCFIRKHWPTLIRASFPHIPVEEEIQFSKSKLLIALADTTCGKKDSQSMQVEKIAHHISALSKLLWNAFAIPAFKEAIDSIKAETKYLTDILERHRSYLKGKLSPAMRSITSGKSRGVASAFKKNLNLVQLSEDEFHVQIDSAFRPNRPKMQRSKFATSVKDSVTNVFSILRHSNDYMPVFLNDAMMGIDKFANDTSDSFMSPVSRAKYRHKFRDELAYGIAHMTIHVFGKVNSGSDTDSLFVWKVPTVQSPQHVGLVAKTIESCRKSLPKEVSKEAVRQFNAVINGLTSLPAKARDALRNIIFADDPNPDESLADEYIDFVMNVCAGEPIDESMLVDGRASNSRGGKGFDATKFDEFWTACKEVLMPDARAEERRHSDVMYSSEAHSIPNLIAKATAVLQKKVVDGKLDELPPIPCQEWVACQFVPNCAHRDAASKFTGRLEMKRAVQSRTLRKEHPDEHWVRALIRYYKEWMVELKHDEKFDGIEYWGQDDKAKIPIGEQVHVSTGTRANNRGMVSATNDNHLNAGDHDYVVGRVIPHVSLHTNIPPDMSGSFFVGDEETGCGQIYVTLTDAVFDPSEIFDHCAQLIDALEDKKLKPTVLVLQTDGGPDHSLRRVAVKLALVALFLELQLDRLVVLRCAPNGSAGNPVERSMSVLNLPLAHTSLRRADMPPYAEDAMKNVNSMAALRQLACKMDGKQKEAAKEKANLEQRLNAALACNDLQSFISKHDFVETAQVNATISSIYSFAGVKLGRNNNVTAAMETDDGGVQVERSGTLHVDVLRHQLAQVDPSASRNFRNDWSESVKKPMDLIAEKFAQLETSGRKVIVRPRVTADKVQALHSQLEKVDPNYSSAIMTKEHLGKVPLIGQFIETHGVISPYHVDLVKCKNHACCGELKTPLHVQELALQRQPTPVNDPANAGHFYCRNDALKVFAGNTAAFTNLSDLPSQSVEKATTKAEKKKRDTAIAKALGKNIWAANRVRCFVTCFHCAKRRCVYSPDKAGYLLAATALTQKLESVSERYSCGDLLFDDSDPLSKVLVQKMNLTCESDIENGYYNDHDRALRLQDICFHCGETEDTGSAGTFLLGQKQLEERCLTGGYTCRPICVECLEMKRKVVTFGRKDELKAREEKRRAHSRSTS